MHWLTIGRQMQSVDHLVLKEKIQTREKDPWCAAHCKAGAGGRDRGPWRECRKLSFDFPPGSQIHHTSTQTSTHINEDDDHCNGGKQWFARPCNQCNFPSQRSGLLNGKVSDRSCFPRSKLLSGNFIRFALRNQVSLESATFFTKFIFIMDIVGPSHQTAIIRGIIEREDS